MKDKLAKKLEDAGYRGEYDLSSLIEECGVGLISITNENSFSHSGGKSKEIKWDWSAIGIQEPYPKGGYRHGMGKTPKIAVARLWLALNKK